ncbi:MAG: potassium channel protein, partial [Verrucomicrobiae bacterium]|nr:potassium channel protein [Verrucomicrobiae bacterium]
MSTLGFGDITFHTDIGRLFSIVVLATGVIFMLVLLPFSFIEFFYAPWVRAQENARAPRKVPEGTRGHVLLTRYGPVTSVLVKMLVKYRYPYFILVPTIPEALQLHNQGLRVVVGEMDDPETYERVCVKDAGMVVATRDEIINTNVTFTVRALAPALPIVASATSEAGRDVLQLAGATHVIRLEEITGQAMARRVVGNDAVAHVIGEVDGVLIAEAAVADTPLVGKTIGEAEVFKQTGVNVIALWDHGRLQLASRDTKMLRNSVLVLAGTREQIDAYSELLCIYHVTEAYVIILGGGRVGRATAMALSERGLDWRIIEKLPERVRFPDRTIVGDGSEIEILNRAGLDRATAIIITSNDDDNNVFLTILCRRLRDDVQIISRSTDERSMATLHRAGADLVLSYGVMGANTIFNTLHRSDTVLMAQGINIFPTPIPKSLAGHTVARSEIRNRTGCSIVAVESHGKRVINPRSDFELPVEGKLVLIGTLEAEETFLKEFPE